MSHDLPAPPRFDWGQRVRAVADLANDGTFPGAEPEALLVACGAIGEVVQIGAHVESGATLYLVEFGPERVVGCFEQELEHA